MLGFVDHEHTALLSDTKRHRPGSFARTTARRGVFMRADAFLPRIGNMAGDWIKLRHDLADDPAVISLVVNTTCVDAEHVIGKLHKLWSWADRHTSHGTVKGVPVTWVDEFVGVKGFSAALISCGWLVLRERYWMIPKFNRHNSKSAKNRALAAQRQVTHRSRSRNGDSVTDALPEKSRVKKKRVKKEGSIFEGTSFEKKS